ncbi:hypothetical protein HELRODRAFT_175327 [Helobdella robusta]|uniref:Uncharacterized protein n=1 Tax=Helobdella robusta TaxID=6412 RepID=T1F951_HELRO|nr:hypothetical protein HELRODRAFT_175327 [Helobdella robusta]ESO00834.1 hypothetical protein HELRODRAFT_175327 [Helobdella robusta]
MSANDLSPVSGFLPTTRETIDFVMFRCPRRILCSNFLFSLSEFDISDYMIKVYLLIFITLILLGELESTGLPDCECIAMPLRMTLDEMVPHCLSRHTRILTKSADPERYKIRVEDIGIFMPWF